LERRRILWGILKTSVRAKLQNQDPRSGRKMMKDLAIAKVSFILPARNEADRIATAIRGLSGKVEDFGIDDYEIIVIDDGSTDGTRQEALKVADGTRVKVFGYANNAGKGFAVKCGVERASGGLIFFLDSDLEIKAAGLGIYFDALRHYELVVASKRHPNSKVEAPFMRRFLSYGFQALVKILIGIKVSDTQSGLKAGKAEALRRIFKLVSVRKYAFDVEMLAVAQLLECRIKELPIEITLGAQFRLRHMVRMLIDVLGIAYRLRIKRWYQASLHKEQPKCKFIVR